MLTSRGRITGLTGSTRGPQSGLRPASVQRLVWVTGTVCFAHLNARFTRSIRRLMSERHQPSPIMLADGCERPCPNSFAGVDRTITFHGRSDHFSSLISDGFTGGVR